MESERLVLYAATDIATSFVHAEGVDHVDRLLGVPFRVRRAVELGVHRGVAAALTIAQIHSGRELRHLARLHAGQTLAEHGSLLRDFGGAVDAVVAEVSVEEILDEVAHHHR